MYFHAQTRGVGDITSCGAKVTSRAGLRGTGRAGADHSNVTAAVLPPQSNIATRSPAAGT